MCKGAVGDGQTSQPQPFRRHLFNTNPATPAEDRVLEESDPNEPLVAYPPQIVQDQATIREIAELKLSVQQMNSQIHQAISAAPWIDNIIASTSRSPFTSELTSVQLRKMEKLCLPSTNQAATQSST